MKYLRIVLYFVVLFLFVNVHCSRQSDKKKVVNTPPKPVKLNIEGLPTLTEILTELDLLLYLKNFISMGVTETRLLLRLNSMDFNIMSYDWMLPEKEIETLRAYINILIIKATVKEDHELELDYKTRNTLSYGRIYLPQGVQSFEYKQASFGSPPPVGLLEIVISDPFDGCQNSLTTTPINIIENDTVDNNVINNMRSSINNDGTIDTNDSDTNDTNTGSRINDNNNDKTNQEIKLPKHIPNYTGKVLFIMRGNCSFLEKADYALQTNASTLIIINDVDILESFSSGLGVNKNITEKNVLKINNKLSVISISNTSMAKINYSLKLQLKYTPLFLHIIPLRCKSAGVCLPILESEKKLRPEISSGILKLKDQNNDHMKTFEFITSNFGGIFSNLPYSFVMSSNRDGCTKIDKVILYRNGNYNNNSNNTDNNNNSNNNNNNNNPVAIVLDRGECAFDVKALNVQNAGAQLMVVVDREDNALQRLGGSQPVSGYVGIPSIIVTKLCGEFIELNIQNNKNNQKHIYNNINKNITISNVNSDVNRNNNINTNNINNNNNINNDNVNNLAGEIIPSEDSLGFDRWVEIAFIDWAVEVDDQLIQIEGLIQKYTRTASSEIIAWLKRRAEKIER